MGLSVSVYKNVKLANDDDDNIFMAYVASSEWDYKISNLKQDEYYTGELYDSFVSYHYSSHSRFRETLLKIICREDLLLSDGEINWNKIKTKSKIPFYELIYFSDCEGCLDFEISTKLYGEFIEWEDRAMVCLKDDEYSKETYLDWLGIFKDGKQKNSVVVFS